MICHKHIEGVEAIVIVSACRDGDALLTGIVVPAVGIAIPLVAFLYQIFKTVDTLGLEHLIRFGKDGVAQLTFLGPVALGIVCHIVVVVGDGVLNVLACLIGLVSLRHRVCQACQLQCLCKDGVILQTSHAFTHPHGVFRNHIVQHIEIAITGFYLTDGLITVVYQRLSIDLHQSAVVFIAHGDRHLQHGGFGALQLNHRDGRTHNVVESNVVAQAVGQSLQGVGGHTIVQQFIVTIYRHFICIEAVDIPLNSLVGGCKAGHLLIGIEYTVHARTLQDIVERRKILPFVDSHSQRLLHGIELV